MVRLLVRTWNLAHGRTSPETRDTYLEEMVRLVTKDAPDVVCLQEVPVWALSELEAWSGMRAFGAVAMPELAGPFARRITELDPRRIRSAVSGQANAVLLDGRLDAPDAQAAIALNPRSFRRSEAGRLGLSSHVRLAWARNRRVAQAVRVAAESWTVTVVNTHLTSSPHSRVAEAELARAITFAERFARAGEPVLLCGDLNLSPASSLALRELAAGGFSPPSPGVDHILGRGLTPGAGPLPWPDRRRRLGDVLLSDHAPLEAEMIGL